MDLLRERDRGCGGRGEYGFAQLAEREEEGGELGGGRRDVLFCLLSL